VDKVERPAWKVRDSNSREKPALYVVIRSHPHNKDGPLLNFAGFGANGCVEVMNNLWALTSIWIWVVAFRNSRPAPVESGKVISRRLVK